MPQNSTRTVTWRACIARAARAAVAISLLCGILTALSMMALAWSHNSQGEIHIDGSVYWGYWLLIGFSWLVATTSALLPPTFAAALLWYRLFSPLRIAA